MSKFINSNNNINNDIISLSDDTATAFAITNNSNIMANYPVAEAVLVKDEKFTTNNNKVNIIIIKYYNYIIVEWLL